MTIMPNIHDNRIPDAIAAYTIFAFIQGVALAVLYYSTLGCIWILYSLHSHLMDLLRTGELVFPTVYILPGLVFLVFCTISAIVYHVIRGIPSYWKATSMKKIREYVLRASQEIEEKKLKNSHNRT